MGLIGWLLRPVELDAGEVVRWCVRANRQQSGWRAVGGELCVTNYRIVFTPNRVDIRLRGRPWSSGFQDLASVGIEPRGAQPFSGAWRQRLRVVMTDGTVELFVVDDVASVVERMRAMAASSERAGSATEGVTECPISGSSLTPRREESRAPVVEGTGG